MHLLNNSIYLFMTRNWNQFLDWEFGQCLNVAQITESQSFKIQANQLLSIGNTCMYENY